MRHPIQSCVVWKRWCVCAAMLVLAFALRLHTRLGDSAGWQHRVRSIRVIVGERVPMTRIPPLNGTAEAIYQRSSFGSIASVRWAAPSIVWHLQTMPMREFPVWTPGFVVVDLRTSFRIR